MILSCPLPLVTPSIVQMRSWVQGMRGVAIPRTCYRGPAGVVALSCAEGVSPNLHLQCPPSQLTRTRNATTQQVAIAPWTGAQKFQPIAACSEKNKALVFSHNRREANESCFQRHACTSRGCLYKILRLSQGCLGALSLLRWLRKSSHSFPTLQGSS